jgi:hypothetical protein
MLANTCRIQIKDSVIPLRSAGREIREQWRSRLLGNRPVTGIGRFPRARACVSRCGHIFAQRVRFDFIGRIVNSRDSTERLQSLQWPADPAHQPNRTETFRTAIETRAGPLLTASELLFISFASHATVGANVGKAFCRPDDCHILDASELT